MLNRTLVTTALEDTWPAPETPVLFLGEWCRLHRKKSLWQQRDAIVAPYHWDDRAKLYSDYKYLQILYEHLLKDLAAQLNQIHAVDHSLRYWRIIIGPWLGHFVQVLFDRWESIHQAIARFDISESLCVAEQEACMSPNDMEAFTTLSREDSWNHHIYIKILKRFTSVRVVPNGGRSAIEFTHAIRYIPVRVQLKRALLNWYSSAISVAQKDSDAFFLNTYLPNQIEYFFGLRFSQPPQLWRTVAPVEVAIDNSWRQWEVAGESRSTFEACARALIPAQIPAVYLEGYQKIIQQAAALPWPKNPKLIWTSNSWWADDTFKVWAAAKVEQGTPLVIGQHGGGYGMNLWEFTEEHQIAICDRFFTWGWTEPGQTKLKPVGALKTKVYRLNRHRQPTKALLVTYTNPQQSYHLVSAFVGSQWLAYFNDQCNFVSNLTETVRQALTIWLYPTDYGWDQAARWRDRFPTLQLDGGRSKIVSMYRNTRLIIATGNHTVYLETIMLDVPTVIFWNPQHSELRDSAIPYFEDLKRVGIFHESPDSAAKHVNSIWGNVNAWWQSPELQEVLERFSKRYCYTPGDLLNRVEAALRETITEHKTRPRANGEG